MGARRELQLRSVEGWDNLRKVGQIKGYFDRITKFGTRMRTSMKS